MFLWLTVIYWFSVLGFYKERLAAALSIYLVFLTVRYLYRDFNRFLLTGK